MKDDTSNVFLGLIRSKVGEINPRQKDAFRVKYEALESNGYKSQPTRSNVEVIEDYMLSIRKNIIDEKKESIPIDGDFEVLDQLLSVAPNVNYEEYLYYSSKAPQRVQRFFSAQNFLMFPKDKRGAIASEAFLRYS